MRKNQPITFSSDEIDSDADEKVPYIVGRNALRLVARSIVYLYNFNYSIILNATSKITINTPGNMTVNSEINHWKANVIT